MSKYFFGSVFLIVTFFGLGQFPNSSGIELPEDKVDWKFYVEQDGCEATINGKLTIVKHWHINATKLPEDNFGLPTVFDIKKTKDFEFVGGIIEPKPIKKFDKASGENLSYHDGTIYLKRKIRILTDKDFKLSLTFSFQPCDSVKCLMLYEEIIILDVKGCQNPTAPSSIQSNVSSSEDDSIVKNDESNANNDERIEENQETSNSDVSQVKELSENSLSDRVKNKSLIRIFILSFLSGFAALLTPCVFPMIPMTVSFFTKTSKNKAQGVKNAIIYGVSIIVIYILLGTLVTAIFGAETLNNMSTDPVFNIIFFVLLVVFAVSFMGAFEIRMPSSWVNKADQKADKGGLIGIFFMALALALVSFSCTGPIVGSLLVQAASEGGIAPFVGMFGFSLALALPFALFAMFPGWLNSLPKSGGWLNTVKVVLGILELALAFKFLSNADLSLQTHFLERELFLAIWIAIFAFLTMYLFGFIRMPHDSPLEKLSVGRSMLGLSVFVFVIYMIPGLWGAPLKLISAFPPPMSYSESPLGFGGAGQHQALDNVVDGMHLGPQNIMVFHEYDKALAYSKKVGKPLLIDFTGHNCVNCRKMEQSVWGEPGVIDVLKNEVVIVSLHIDERISLPKAEQKEVVMPNGKNRTLKTTGDKWMFLQIARYKVAAQPYYRMVDNEGNDLVNGSADYENHRDVNNFKKWLTDGLNDFKNGK